MGQKDSYFLFLSIPEPMVTILGLENHTSKNGFFYSPCIAVLFEYHRAVFTPLCKLERPIRSMANL